MDLRSQGPVNELTRVFHDSRIPLWRPLPRPPSPSSLADVIGTILDKGLVIDIHVRVSLVGIEILTGGSS